MKSNTIAILGLGAVAAYFLLKPSGEDSIGSTVSRPAYYGSGPLMPAQTGGPYGNAPPVIQFPEAATGMQAFPQGLFMQAIPANSSNDAVDYYRDLIAAGATPDAAGQFSTMHSKKAIGVTKGGGIVSELSGGGFEAISPEGLGYSTRSAEAAEGYATGSKKSNSAGGVGGTGYSSWSSWLASQGTQGGSSSSSNSGSASRPASSATNTTKKADSSSGSSSSSNATAQQQRASYTANLVRQFVPSYSNKWEG